MRVLIVDDEAPARDRLRALLAEVAPEVRVAGEAADAASALARVREGGVDLVLLDIRMPGGDGIACALEMQRCLPAPAVVFVTAFGEHALAAFEASAIDYLLKPVRATRLRAALDKAARFSSGQRAALEALCGGPALTVSQRGGTQRIPLSRILCLRAESKYVEVHHEAGMALCDDSLKSIEARFPGRFLRVHRKALVAPERVRALWRGEDGHVRVELEGLDFAPEVSRRHLPAVRRLLRG